MSLISEAREFLKEHGIEWDGWQFPNDGDQSEPILIDSFWPGGFHVELHSEIKPNERYIDGRYYLAFNHNVFRIERFLDYGYRYEFELVKDMTLDWIRYNLKHQGEEYAKRLREYMGHQREEDTAVINKGLERFSDQEKEKLLKQKQAVEETYNSIINVINEYESQSKKEQ